MLGLGCSSCRFSWSWIGLLVTCKSLNLYGVICRKNFRTSKSMRFTWNYLLEVLKIPNTFTICLKILVLTFLLYIQECCICLSSYEDGAELHALPCNHHFHSTCIVKWLKMNATCPLCKYNILKGSEQV